LAEIIGHVDARNRPIVRLSIAGLEDDVPAIVDTGFNGELLINESDVGRFQLRLHDFKETVELADRRQELLPHGTGRVLWFGRLRSVNVFIAQGDQPRAARPDEPVALLGTALLSPHKLTVDFATRRVFITDTDQAGAS